MSLNLIKGKNDLETVRPDLAEEWDNDKNQLKPSEVLSGSSSYAWWKCNKGHIWRARINNRSVRNEGCPYCTNKKVLAGFNDLATTNPELLKDWDYEKNTVKPTEISFGYRNRVWWKCDKGHSWEGYVHNRRKGHGCPVCSNLKIVKGYNDMLTFYPELLKEWDYEKNDVSPEDVGCCSGKKVWWKCPICGYNWRASVVKRAKYNHGCPVCKGTKILEGYNDLAILRPDIAKCWDYEKNGDLLPTQVGLGSSKKAWFKCNEGHSYHSFIHARVNALNECPVCYHLGRKHKSKKGRGKDRHYFGKPVITKDGLEIYE